MKQQNSVQPLGHLCGTEPVNVAVQVNQDITTLKLKGSKRILRLPIAPVKLVEVSMFSSYLALKTRKNGWLVKKAKWHFSHLPGTLCSATWSLVELFHHHVAHVCANIGQGALEPSDNKNRCLEHSLLTTMINKDFLSTGNFLLILMFFMLLSIIVDIITSSCLLGDSSWAGVSPGKESKKFKLVPKTSRLSQLREINCSTW